MALHQLNILGYLLIIDIAKINVNNNVKRSSITEALCYIRYQYYQ